MPNIKDRFEILAGSQEKIEQGNYAVFEASIEINGETALVSYTCKELHIGALCEDDDEHDHHEKVLTAEAKETANRMIRHKYPELKVIKEI